VFRVSRTSSPVSVNWRLAPLLPSFFFFSFAGFFGRVSPATNKSSGSWVLVC
jgi:hypothetical protein